MPVSKQLQRFFTPKIRAQGLNLFHDKDIHLSKLNSNHLVANAFGCRIETINIRVPQPNLLYLSCTCLAEAAHQGLCLHMWAALLEAEQMAWAPNLPGSLSDIKVKLFKNEADMLGVKRRTSKPETCRKDISKKDKIPEETHSPSISDMATRTKKDVRQGSEQSEHPTKLHYIAHENPRPSNANVLNDSISDLKRALSKLKGESNLDASDTSDGSLAVPPSQVPLHPPKLGGTPNGELPLSGVLGKLSDQQTNDIPKPLLQPLPSLATPNRPTISWQKALNNVHRKITSAPKPDQTYSRRLIYQIDIHQSTQNEALTLQVYIQERNEAGIWGQLKLWQIDGKMVESWPDAKDKNIMAMLLGAHSTSDGPMAYQHVFQSKSATFTIPTGLQGSLLQALCQTGRARLKKARGEVAVEKLTWDGGPSWQFQIQIEKTDGPYQVKGYFKRGQDVMALHVPHLVIPGGFLFWSECVYTLDITEDFGWISMLRQQGYIEVPTAESADFLENIHQIPTQTGIYFPEALRLQAVSPEPSKELNISTQSYGFLAKPIVLAQVLFNYDGICVTLADTREKFVDHGQQKIISRNLELEQSTFNELLEVGFKEPTGQLESERERKMLCISPEKLPKAIGLLLVMGWKVESEGKPYRLVEGVELDITTDNDWFELEGEVCFDDQRIGLPQLLDVMRKGKNLIRLDDGTLGVLPESWIKKYTPLTQFGTVKPGGVRFHKNQAGLVDAITAGDMGVNVDAQFESIRKRLIKFSGLKPGEAKGEFLGQLRDYQKDGLGWFTFLQENGMGGCLADDMGLGKTVQILALLECNRVATNNKIELPALIVVPRSLLFNWRKEAEKFTPKLKVIVYSGSKRKEQRKDFKSTDIVITTYGLLRRDITWFAGNRFGYIILDEAQAIKNPASQMAKAARMLRAEHRIALSGTPIENHIGELWSLFEFLNPGMLGRVSAFNTLQDDNALQMLRQALKPFILRRTKSQVAKELPTKTEQVIYCEMDEKQKEIYNDLKEGYKSSLTGKITDNGLGQSKMHVLEALLRLRQAACHPGLVDSTLAKNASAKMDTLWEQLKAVTEEGHKVLVFSQFTSLLGLLKGRMDDNCLPYLYLDGSTRDREGIVESFQTDEKNKVFLISLKAGGVGLNLTRAEYVYILDPWWNPAAEAQAIDRAYRIGQKNKVFAYRLISRGTVEERVLELQKQKRKLAESIISEDSGLLKNMTQDDLSFLLS